MTDELDKMDRGPWLGQGAGDLRERRAARERRARRRRIAAGLALAVLLIVSLVAFGAWRLGTGGGKADSANAADTGAGASSAVMQDGAASNGEGGDSGTGSGGFAAMQTVTDSLGRAVEVPAEPQHIAIMDSFSSELAVMIGAGPQVCGMPAGVSSDCILQMIYPELATAPVALSGNAVNIESLMQLGCDVALVKSTMASDELAKLDNMGIPYVVVDYTTFTEQMDAIRLVGQVCGTNAAARAEALAARYEVIAAEVSARVAKVDERDRVRVYHSINDALLTDSATSLGADWITLAGCVDVSAGEAATSGTDYNAVLEQVYAWDPDLVICNVAQTAALMREDAKWAGLRAVDLGKVRNIPIGATRWGQRGSVETALAMVWLGCEAYPELFSGLDLKQLTVEYYRDCLGVEVDDALYEQILSGEGIRSTGSGSGSGGGNGGNITGNGTGAGSDGSGNGTGGER